jgi:hypothetical protein
MSSSLLTLSQISTVTASSENNSGACSGGRCGPAQATLDGVGTQDDDLSFYESSPGNLLSPLSPSLSLSLSHSIYLSLTLTSSLTLYLSLFLPSHTLSLISYIPSFDLLLQFLSTSIYYLSLFSPFLLFYLSPFL